MTDELRVARDVMDEIREDLSWVSRNGVPGHREGHTQLLRMARDPLASDANELIEVITSTVASANSSEHSADALDKLVSEIAEFVTVFGQEQVNLLLSTLDDARSKLVAAIKTSSATPSASQESTVPLSSPPSTSPAPVKPSQTQSLF